MNCQCYNIVVMQKEVNNMTQALEATMLVCFGLSWPMNLVKNFKAGTAKSMSLKFILLIIFGYLAGISAKLLTHQLNYVLIVYFLNIAIVSLNLGVYFLNKHKDKQREKEQIPVQEIIDSKTLILDEADTKDDKTIYNSVGQVDFFEAMNR